MKTKLRSNPPQLGDVVWFVEYCTYCPVYEDNSCNIDEAKYARIQCKDEAHALATAKQVYPLDFFGAVQYWPAQLTDDIGMGIRSTFTWEATADPKEYSGD